ncbi:hypothetical protein JCM33374_g714 [Metschnikowia sp. JCM 33374]|nr:hypothetical protein JCM33374_g714 [Metschnikowia sp. JCM 33374]
MTQSLFSWGRSASYATCTQTSSGPHHQRPVIFRIAKTAKSWSTLKPSAYKSSEFFSFFAKMLKFKNKFKFGSSEKEPAKPVASSSDNHVASKSSNHSTSASSPVPDFQKLSLAETESQSTADVSSSPLTPQLSNQKKSFSENPHPPTVMASNPGVLIVKIYRSQSVKLPINIKNDKQILQALAQNTNDANVSALLTKRLAELSKTESSDTGTGTHSADSSVPELLPGTLAASLIPSNINIPNSTGERTVKPLLFMTVEFDNNMIMVESRKGSVDSCQWDRVMTFDVTKMVAHSQTSANFLNINLYLRLPNRLVPTQERQEKIDMFTVSSSNTFGDLQIGSIKLPLNLRCHTKAIRLIDHEFLKFKTNLDALEEMGDISLSIDFKPQLKAHLSIEDFDLLKVIGKGSFGKVMQVMKKDTKQIYALKTLRKQHIVSRMEVTHTLAERTVLARINNPFIVPLKFSFQSPEKLYLVLSFINGGELFYHLQKSGKFSLDRSRFYIAELLTALESLHDLDVIYRDLKPENILIDYQGHIALCDFGLCKLNMTNDDKTNTFCGTPEYLAPELLLNQGYTRSVDWWTLGTLLYEMLTGLPPFYDDDVSTMYKKILQNPLKFPSFLSGTDAEDLLTKLLQKDPSKRLSDAPTIKSHPFFQNIDWKKLLDKGYAPPFKPTVNGFLDTSNFDQDFTNERPQDSVVDDFLSESVQKQFGGWTYNGETVL